MFKVQNARVQPLVVENLSSNAIYLSPLSFSARSKLEIKKSEGITCSRG